MENASQDILCEFSFRRDKLQCSYRLVRERDQVLLYGEEAENGNAIFRLLLSFSLEQQGSVRDFATSLSETKTYPRMMAELAEDYSFGILSK